MDSLEAVADAIMSFEGWKLGSLSYKHRNPGNIRDTPSSYKTFPTFVEGYQALLAELRAKFSGHNSHGIGPSSTLLDLFNIYAPPSDNNPTNAYCRYVAGWVSTALEKAVTEQTKLGDIWTP